MLTRSKSKVLGANTDFQQLPTRSQRSKRSLKMTSNKEVSGTPSHWSQELTDSIRRKHSERGTEFSQLGGQPSGQGKSGLKPSDHQVDPRTRNADHAYSSTHFSSDPAHNRSDNQTGSSRDGLPPPSPFDGKSSEDAETWLKNFILWSEIRHHSKDQKIQMFPYLLRGAARVWYDTQKSGTTVRWDDLCEAFLSRYVQQDLSNTTGSAKFLPFVTKADLFWIF